MTPGKQAAAIGVFAFAVVLMVLSYYQSFVAGARPAPPEAGKLIAARVQKLEAEYAATHPRGSRRADLGVQGAHSMGPGGPLPDQGGPPSK